MSRAASGVIVTGNIVIDTIVHPVADIVWGGTRWVENIAQQLGGNGGNTAAALAILGIDTRLVGWIGRDGLGQHARAALSNAAVNLQWIAESDTPTASTIALVAPDGRRALLHHPGVSLEGFSIPIQFTPELCAGVRHFHLGNPYSMIGLRRHAAETLRSAKSAGLSTSLDTAWDSKGEWGKILEPCLPHIDILFVNETEAEILENGGTKLAAPAVVKKLGEKGCEVNGVPVSGFSVEAIDTTGAGDCFAGGFLAAWLRGASLIEAAKVANAVGALSVSRLGSITGLLGYEETLSWMRRK